MSDDQFKISLELPIHINSLYSAQNFNVLRSRLKRVNEMLVSRETRLFLYRPT